MGIAFQKKHFIILITAVFIIGCIIMISIRSKSQIDMSSLNDEEASSIASSYDSDPDKDYNLYNEIKQFMAKQTTYLASKE